MTFTYKNNIIFGEEENWTIRKGGIGKVYFDSMKKFSTRTAQIEAKTGKKDTYETLLNKCVRLAIELNRLDVSRQDIITLWSDNNLDACVPLIAAQFIGAITFAIEPDQTPEDAANLMIKQLPPKVLFTTQNLYEKSKKALEIANVPAKIIVFEDAVFRDILNIRKESENDFVPIYIEDLNDTAVYHFTSGSTGTPKIVKQSHYFLFAADGDSAKSLGCYDDREAVVYTLANWFWGAATRVLVLGIIHGACRVLEETYEAKEIMEYTEKYRISHMLIATPVLYNLKENKGIIENYDTSSLRSLNSVGQRIDPICMEVVRKALPSVSIFNYYGQSEVGAITIFDDRNKEHVKLMMEKPTSVGLPVEGISYKIVNPETEEIMGFNQKGEIRVKTKRYCPYLNRDPAENVDEAGWYKTGDVGYYDEDFCFFIVDRIKDEFKYHLWHISPGYLENVILGHPAIAKVVVVGKPHLVEGALPTALVILREGSENVSEQEIVDFVEKRVDDRMRLRGGVRFFKKFPLTATKKINRIALRKIIEEESHIIYE